MIAMKPAPAHRADRQAEKSRSPRPHKRLALLTIALLLLSTAPYAVANHRTPPGATYTGLTLKPFDQYYYLAAQRSAADDLSRANRFTAEPDAAGPIAPLYRFLGELASRTHFSIVAAYHLPRILVALLLPALLWCLYARCFPRRRDLRWMALVLALFAVAFRGGGNIPEATVLYSVMAIPHFALAITGFVLAMTAILSGWCRRHALVVLGLGGTAGLLVGATHTFLLLPIVLVLTFLSATAALRAAQRFETWDRVRLLLLAGGSILLPAVPFLLQLRAEMTRFETQQEAPFPITPGSSADWLTVYGAVVPLFVLGLAAIWRNRRTWIAADQPIPVVLVWIAVQGALMFSSVTPFQRRFIEGLIIPVAVVAALGADLVLQHLKTIRTQALAVGCSLILLGVVTAVVQTAISGTYLEDPYQQALDQIADDDVVLTGDSFAEQIPAFSSGTVYLGRYVETLHYRQKLAFRDSIAKHPTDPTLAQKLRREGVTMVIVDRSDPTFPLDIERLDAPCFTPAFRSGALIAVHVSCDRHVSESR